jgi:hypothetical protein
MSSYELSNQSNRTATKGWLVWLLAFTCKYMGLATQQPKQPKTTHPYACLLFIARCTNKTLVALVAFGCCDCWRYITGSATTQPVAFAQQRSVDNDTLNADNDALSTSLCELSTSLCELSTSLCSRVGSQEQGLKLFRSSQIDTRDPRFKAPNSDDSSYV